MKRDDQNTFETKNSRPHGLRTGNRKTLRTTRAPFTTTGSEVKRDGIDARHFEDNSSSSPTENRFTIRTYGDEKIIRRRFFRRPFDWRVKLFDTRPENDDDEIRNYISLSTRVYRRKLDRKMLAVTLFELRKILDDDDDYRMDTVRRACGVSSVRARKRRARGK